MLWSSVILVSRKKKKRKERKEFASESQRKFVANAVSRARSTKVDFPFPRYIEDRGSVKRYELIAAMTIVAARARGERISRHMGWNLLAWRRIVKRRHFITASRYRLHIILALPYPLRDSIYSRDCAYDCLSGRERRPSPIAFVGTSPPPSSPSHPTDVNLLEMKSSGAETLFL